MSSPLTLENSLILACARTDPDAQLIQELVERSPDWPEILRKAVRCGMAPLVHTNLWQAAGTSRVPTTVAENLKHLYHRDAVRNIFLCKALGAILTRFAEASVAVIVLKDTALATVVYPSRTLRPMESIDLLVRKRDLDNVDELVRSMRYARSPPGVSASGSCSDARHHTRYLGPEGFPLLDVRHHILSPDSAGALMPAAEGLPIEDFWERARPVEIASVAAREFSHEDLLVHLALHLACPGESAGHLRTLCDIGEVCRRYGDGLDWNRIAALARAYKMEKVLYYALRLARELVGAGVPSTALAELRANFRQLPLEDRLMTLATRQAILCDGQDPDPSSRSYSHGARLLATLRPGDGVTQVCRHLAQGYLRRLRPLAGRDGVRRTRFTWRRARLPATAIVLPVYRPRLDTDALMAVDRAFAVLRHGDWHLIAPQSLDTSFYERRYRKPIVRFPDAAFASPRTYSGLLLTDGFYAAFAQYKYMLITQDDAYVLRDDLPYWLSRRFDYIGAPWWPDGRGAVLDMSRRPGIDGLAFRSYVANGGFSLRRLAACRQLITEFREEADWFRQHGWGEDLFFAFFGQFSQQFVLPNLRVAAAFAWEVSLPRMYALCQGQLPMAIHGYDKYDFEFFARSILPKALSIVDRSYF